MSGKKLVCPKCQAAMTPLWELEPQPQLAAKLVPDGVACHVAHYWRCRCENGHEEDMDTTE